MRNRSTGIDGPVVHDMRLDYFIYVFRANAAVEHTFRIDRDGRSQLALIEAPRLIGVHQRNAALGEFDFEQPLQFPLTGWIAATSRMIRLALIHAK
jgi:hypothetical protein